MGLEPDNARLRGALRSIVGLVQSAEEAYQRSDGAIELTGLERECRRRAREALNHHRTNGKVIDILEAEIGDLKSQLIDASAWKQERQYLKVQFKAEIDRLKGLGPTAELCAQVAEKWAEEMYPEEVVMHSSVEGKAVAAQGRHTAKMIAKRIRESKGRPDEDRTDGNQTPTS